MPPSAGEVARPQSPLRAMMPQSPLRIKQGGKFYERLLTKESSGANPSFRYYGSEPGSVPFVWESEPGTPRDASRMKPPEQHQHGRHDDQVPAAKSSAVVCSGARQMSPCWMLPFRGTGNRNRDRD
ncbi:hypothetical protein TRIUR3_20305 [Triticum urartu]|uniref:Uncharacterized protein n=2 Tax=Triticum TaxID=4564 RepID=A0A9R0VNH9_TRITD|nr:hypothetical protein TRIUR3_20305 [Triticum urartu]VAH65492.1 unnamed protein product [Triticum turgidum subsp. durum]